MSSAGDPPSETDPPSRGDAAKWLAGSIPVAVALLTFAGVTGDELGRVVRTYPVAYTLGVLALVLAAGLGVFAIFSARRKWLLVSGVVAFALGTACLVSLHALVSSKQDRPTVAASLVRSGGATTAKVTVRATGLKPDQYVFVAVQGQNSQHYLDEQSAEYAEDQQPAIGQGQFSKQRIYSGRIGATPDGKVDSSFEVPVAASLYEQVVVQAAILSGKNGKAKENAIMGGKGRTRAFACGPGSKDISCITVLLPTPSAPVD